jgi:hypothetical protein
MELEWAEDEDSRFSHIPLTEQLDQPDEVQQRPSGLLIARAHLRRPLVAARDASHARRPSPPNPTGLSATHRVKARDLMMEAAALGYERRASLHYTQGVLRWQGINQRDKAWRNQCPHYGDCSSFSTWCGWNGLDHYHLRDYFNGLRWHAGYTGTLLTHGVRVDGRWGLVRGDLLIYGNGFPGKHVAIAVGGGMAISFGSEIGPLRVRVNYRPDLMQARRFI